MTVLDSRLDRGLAIEQKALHGKRVAFASDTAEHSIASRSGSTFRMHAQNHCSAASCERNFNRNESHVPLLNLLCLSTAIQRLVA